MGLPLDSLMIYLHNVNECHNHQGQLIKCHIDRGQGIQCQNVKAFGLMSGVLLLVPDLNVTITEVML